MVCFQGNGSLKDRSNNKENVFKKLIIGYVKKSIVYTIQIRGLCVIMNNISKKRVSKKTHTSREEEYVSAQVALGELERQPRGVYLCAGAFSSL